MRHGRIATVRGGARWEMLDAVRVRYDRRTAQRDNERIVDGLSMRPAGGLSFA